MKTPNATLGTAVLVAVLTLSACSQPNDPAHDMDAQHAASGSGKAHGHDSAMMQRHGTEAKEMEERVRQHLQRMRGLSAAEQHAAMGEHVSVVAGMLSMMDRHMREMGMGGNHAGGNHASMGQMMGMSGAQHDQMMKDMQALRAEVEQMQTLPAAEVGRQMPAHLDRFERMLPMLQQCAGHAHHG